MFQASNFHDNGVVNRIKQKVAFLVNNPTRIVASTTIIMTNVPRHEKVAASNNQRQHSRPPD